MLPTRTDQPKEIIEINQYDPTTTEAHLYQLPNEHTPLTHNRVRRRVISATTAHLFTKASSCAAILAALDGCIEGRSFADKNSVLTDQSRIRVSTRAAYILQRDMSIGTF